MSLETVRARRGFTLIELLVVIVILGMLMSLTSVAVWKMIQTAKEAKIAAEVDQLSQAMVSYKEGQIEYPPSLSNSTLTDRRLVFMKHLNLAYANSAYGLTLLKFSNDVSDTRQWGIRERIMNTTTGGWGYNYLADDGTVTQLDLNTLDQAEALVFWLGGFPTPVNPSTKAPVATRRLFGFHKDTDNPLKRDPASFEATQPLRFRTDIRFGFDDVRLVDNDKDGWLEYTPNSPRSGASSAPYVYFDSASYNKSTDHTLKHFGYPRYNDGSDSESTSAAELYAAFGMAAPLATYFDPSTSNTKPTIWAKNESFQIICPGLDGEYSQPGAHDFADALRVPVFPSGFLFEQATGYTTQSAYTAAEFDNLTNLSSKRLEAARAEALQ